MDLNALRVFERVAATGSFTQTAHHFHRAVSSISRQITTLEESLGQRLLYRHTRAVTLTEAGERYYHDIREILAQLELATEALQAPGTEPAGLLRINAPVAFGERQIVPILNAFQRRYPAIKAELKLTDRLTDPVKEGIDITFRVGELSNTTLVARRLAPMNYVVAAAPAYLQRKGVPATPDALIDHDCLLYQGEMGRQRWYFDHPQAPATLTCKVQGSLYSNSAESLVQAALMGQGLVMFPTWLIARELAEKTLLPVLQGWRGEVAPTWRDIHVLYAQRRLETPKVSAFLDHLFDTLGPVPPWDRWQMQTLADTP